MSNTLQLFVNSLVPVMDVKIIEREKVAPNVDFHAPTQFKYAEGSFAKAIVSDAQSVEIAAALKRANSDVLKGKDGFHFLHTDERGSRIYRFGETYQAEINAMGVKLGLKLSGVYFFEVCTLQIDSSDSEDVQPQAIRCGIKASEFNYAKTLLEDGRLESVAITPYQFEVLGFEGKARDFRFVIDGNNDLKIEFFNDFTNTSYTSQLALNNDYFIATWVSDENADIYDFVEVTFYQGEEGAVEGDLIITSGVSSYVDNETIKRMYDEAPHKDHAFLDSLLDYMATYRYGTVHYYRVLPEWIGALTDAPIITDNEPIHQDDGTVIFDDDAKFWWYPNYQVSSFGERLIENGQVIFDKAPT